MFGKVINFMPLAYATRGIITNLKSLGARWNTLWTLDITQYGHTLIPNTGHHNYSSFWLHRGQSSKI